MKWIYPAADAKDYTFADYHTEKALGLYPGSDDSFCRAYMEAVETAIASAPQTSITKDIRLSHTLHDAALNLVDGDNINARSDNGSQYHYVKRYCDDVNYHHKQIREKINKLMVDYLLTHGTVIDRWPDPCSYYYAHIEDDPAKNRFYFNYFGAPYVPCGKRVRRESNSPIFKHDFHCASDPNVKRRKQMLEAARQRVQEMHSNRSKGGKFKSFISIFPGILAVIFCVLSLACFFFGIDPFSICDATETIMNSAGLLGILMTPLHLLAMLAAALISLLKKHILLFLIGNAFILFCGLGVAPLLREKLRIQKVSSDEYQKAQKELEELEAAYCRLADSEKERKETWTALSKAWNDAFYRHQSEGQFHANP